MREEFYFWAGQNHNYETHTRVKSIFGFSEKENKKLLILRTNILKE